MPAYNLIRMLQVTPDGRKVGLVRSSNDRLFVSSSPLSSVPAARCKNTVAEML